MKKHYYRFPQLFRDNITYSFGSCFPPVSNESGLKKNITQCRQITNSLCYEVTVVANVLCNMGDRVITMTFLLTSNGSSSSYSKVQVDITAAIHFQEIFGPERSP